ncbi:MAG TPA: aminofutalosine synthase MqnE [Thermoguttaceae bacterium]|nr:aminofutalosine synthase MqnE [Thermoguttaceae bacterium]
MSDTFLPGTLDAIRRKVESGERLNSAEGEFLFGEDVDLHVVGQLADLARRRKNGLATYYNVNAHVNPTNVCIYRCKLCAYSCDPDDPRAFMLSDDEILAAAAEAERDGCTELHIVGGLHPEKQFDWYLGIIRRLHTTFPRLHLKAWTAVEIARFAELSGLSIREVLEQMIEAGLGSLPGGGAEIFDPHVRAEICPRKVDAETWLEVHRTAHGLGLRSNATMLYGHIESIDQRIDHLLRLRRLQDETSGFLAFIPLCFHPDRTHMAHLQRTSGLDDLRTVAVSRLMLDNFDHVKAYWISLGLGTAQIAQSYGADDLDGTVRKEKIHHTAGAESPECLSIDELRGLIEETGHEPVERDTLYRRVRREGTEWQIDQPS